MPELEVHWQGRIPLEDVRWEMIPDSEIVLPPDLEERREALWRKTLDDYPDSYDGELLFLSDFSVESTSVFMRTASVRFSRIRTLVSERRNLGEYGSLGFQAMILSSEREHMLIGERSKESMYCPLFLAAPGGMLEVADIEHSFEEACMREVREEAHLDLQPQRYMIALTKELHGHVGAAILIEALATDFIDPSQLVQGNEEWTDGKLRWHPVDELESLDERIMLEGVRFATEQWKLFRDTGDSILF